MSSSSKRHILSCVGEARRKKVATAWHEAGHVVGGIGLGFRLIWSSLKARDLGNGEMSCGQTAWEAPTVIDPLQQTCVALAGKVAEEKRCGTATHDAARDDEAVIQTYAWVCKVGRKDRYKPHADIIPRLIAVYREQPDRVPLQVRHIADDLVSQAMPTTVQAVNDNWSAVERVANLLLKHTTVTPELLSENGISWRE
ncbi:MAG TPA: hypothetical protein VFO39_21315 [Candidatus Sulfotelmatobacter sp.]|nr:hypothetical protein [Candidatus Sulfotelmatobacter sp.]